MFRSPPTGGFRPFGDTGPRTTNGAQRTAWPYGQRVPGPHDWAQQRGSTRNPPAWAPDIENQYPFRHWITDVVTWCMSTDIDEIRKGPQIELCLGGVARDLVREIPVDVKTNGFTLPNGERRTGAWVILQALSAQFMPLEEESNLRALADLHGFCRLPGESVDTVLTRFEVIVQRARTRANVPLQNQHAAWMLLLALRIPTEYWVHLLTPFRGALPTTDQEYRQFLEYVKRFGHLAEAGNYSIAQGATHGSPVMLSQSSEQGSAPCVSGEQGSAPGVSGMMFPVGSAYADELDDSDTSDDEDYTETTYLQREDDEPDMTAWSPNQVGEFFAFQYKRYKKKWRRFTGRPHRRQRPQATRRRTYLTTNDDEWAVFFGKSHGKGHGSKRRGNPIGRDGKPLRCSVCDSTEHLWRQCPTKGGGKGIGNASTNMLAITNGSPQPPHTQALHSTA